MATKTFKIGLSNQDKQNMAQDVYERVLDLTFPEYDTAASYSVGDFVVYNDQLYKCIGNTSGTWDATKWQLATLNDLLTDIESAVAYVNDKANVDGNYPTMTVGNADQLNSTVYVVDKVPYLYRTSGGDADIGNREYDKIIGGSLVVNQLILDSISKTYSNRTPTSYGEQGKGFNNLVDNVYSNLVIGHKVLVLAEISDIPESLEYVAFVAGGNSVNLTSSQPKKATIVSVVNNTHKFIRVYTTDANTFSITIDKYEIIDLTQMLGSTIADYIYALEQANAGAGVAWFRNYFKELYYPYNAGAIKNVKLVSHDTVGFNQWDGENDIKSFANTTYYIYGSATLTYKDHEGNTISSESKSNETFTTPVNCEFIGVNGTGDICINLSWSGWRNGQYEPYQKNSYELDATIELRGIPKLDSDNHLYFDGDEYSSDGKVVRKYGIIDLGTLTYTRIQANSGYYFFDAIIQDILTGSPNGLCSRYLFLYNTNRNQLADKDKVIAMWNNTTSKEIVIRDDSYTDAATFKTAMSGVYLIYELETTTEENADTFQEPQIVDDFGTEEYVVPTQDGWQVPVGHDTKYPANLRDKLQRLPDMPSVSQNVTETYVVNYNGTTKKCTFVDIAGWLGTNGWIKLTDITGYDATATQVLKNVEGTLTWVTEE